MAAMLLSVGTIFHISDDKSGSGECMQHHRQTAFIYLSEDAESRKMSLDSIEIVYYYTSKLERRNDAV